MTRIRIYTQGQPARSATGNLHGRAIRSVSLTAAKEHILGREVLSQMLGD